jgi:glycosyltransferase involved in cell wall biosynthesis
LRSIAGTGIVLHGEDNRVAGARFSVIITCHNQRDFIRDAVDCALSQATAEKEIIVVDDASRDGSKEILEKYGIAIRLVPLEQSGGANVARNSGASVASGEYLVFLDGDDAFMPWTLEVYSAVIRAKHPKVILGNARFFWGALADLKNQEAPDRIEIADYDLVLHKDRTFRASASTIVVKHESFGQVQGWSKDIFPLDDHDLLTKLGCSGRTIQVLYPATILYRLHDSNTMRHVAPFVCGAHKVIRKAVRGEYPGGMARRFKVYAFLGGPISFWVKRAFQSSLYKEACKLMIAGSPMILAAAMQRSATLIKGRRPTEKIALSVANL